MPVTVRQVLQCATVNGARCAAILDRAGTLTPGKEADIVVIRADAMNVYPLNSELGAVVQAAGVHDVDGSLSAGRSASVVEFSSASTCRDIDSLSMNHGTTVRAINSKLDILAS